LEPVVLFLGFLLLVVLDPARLDLDAVGRLVVLDPLLLDTALCKRGLPGCLCLPACLTVVLDLETLLCFLPSVERDLLRRTVA